MTIDRLDASADVLWPANAEEPHPPRWRLDRLEPDARWVRAASEPQHTASGVALLGPCPAEPCV